MKILRYLKRLLPGVVDSELKEAYWKGYTYGVEARDQGWKENFERELESFAVKIIAHVREHADRAKQRNCPDKERSPL